MPLLRKIIPLLALMSGSLLANSPKDVAVHVQLAPAKTVMADLGAFTQSSAMGTPLAMWGNPGMMKMMLPGVLGIPSGLLDESRSVHMLMSFPENGQPPKVGIYIPTLSQDGLNEKLTGMGYQKLPEGGWEKKKGRKKVTLFTAKRGIIMSENGILSAKWVQKTMDEWKNPPLLNRGLTVKAKAKELIDQNEPMMNFMLATMFQKMEMDMKKKPESAVALPFVKGLKETIPLWMDQLGELQMTVNVNGEGINMSHVLLSPKGAILEKTAKAWSSDRTPLPSYAGSLPLDSVSTGSGSMYPNFLKDISPLLMPLFTSLNEVMGKKKMDWVKMYNDAAKNPPSQFASATAPDSRTGYPTNLSIQTLPDPSKSIDMMEDVFIGLNDINTFIPKKDGKTVMGLDFSESKTSKTVNGIKTRTFSMKMLPGAGLTPMEKSQITKNNFNLLTLSKGKEFYSAQAAPAVDTSKTLGDLLNAVSKGNDRVGNKSSWKKAQQKAGGSKIVASIFLIDTIKLAMVAEADLLKNMRMPMDVSSMASTLPNSQIPISMDLKALQNGFDFTIDLPAGAIQETVTAVMQAIISSKATK